MQKLDKSKLVMNLSKKYKLVPYLDKAIAAFDEEWEYKYKVKTGDDAWHPSGDCTPSVIELYESATEPSTFNTDGKLNKAFQVGHFWHQFLQHIILHKLEFCDPEAIERRGSKVWARQNYYYGGSGDGINLARPYHWATGSADIAPLLIPKSGWKGIVDIKTMNSGSFNSSKVPFADKYECQFNIYMDFFDEERALLLGISKDTGEFKEFEYQRNQPLIDVIYEKWKCVGDFLHKEKTPRFLDETEPFDLPLRGPVL
jgi:hypothetical protein